MRNLRNFGITFAVSLVILGIVAVIAAQYVSGAVTAIFDNHKNDIDSILIKPAETTSEDSSKDDIFSKELNGESFTWLMVVYDKRTDVYDDYYPTKSQIEKSEKAGILGKDYRLVEATSIAVVHANVETREYVTMTIPTITKVETGTGDYSIGEVYGIYGIDFFMEKISSMIGLEIDYYTVMNAIDLPSLASSIGAVNCELPVDIGYNGKEYVTFIAPEDTTAAETEKQTEPETAKVKEEDKDKDKDKETEPVETEPVVESELDAASNVKLAKKLHAALLYSDYTDGIDQEAIILSSFVNGVLTNISSSSDNALQNIIRGLEKKMTTNIIAEDIVKCGEVIRAYSWMNKKVAVYPGRLVSASATKEAFYMPDLNEAMEFFYNYR